MTRTRRRKTPRRSAPDRVVRFFPVADLKVIGGPGKRLAWRILGELAPRLRPTIRRMNGRACIDLVRLLALDFGFIDAVEEDSRD